MRRPLKKKVVRKPDMKYDSVLLGQFINYVMKDGKKSIARKVVYDALDEIKKKEEVANPIELFDLAIKNASPSVEVRSRRVGGANYQIPREVRPERRTTLAMRWILTATRNRNGAPTYKHLANELILASKKEGDAIKKKEDTHRMAEANRAFAHFAW